MRVLLVSHVAPPHVGGVEQLVKLEADALVEAGHDVVWLTSDGGGNGEPVIEREGLRVERVRAWHGIERGFRIAYPLFGPGLVFRTWRAVGRADVVHVHGLVFANSILAAVLARLRRRRCVLTDHGGVLRYRSRLGTVGLRLLIETWGRVTARCAHRLIAYNAELQRLLERLSGRPDKVVFLANAVDTARFRPATAAERRAARAALGWDARPRLLFVGRVLPHKGVELVLSLCGAGREVVFVGPAEPAMVERIRAAGATWLPPRAQAELVPLYHAADVLVLPSHNEGFPLVIQEALACGLPVVARDDPAYAPYRTLQGLHLTAAESPAVAACVDAVLAARHEDRSPVLPPWLGRRAWVDRLLAAAGAGAP